MLQEARELDSVHSGNAARVKHSRRPSTELAGGAEGTL